MMYIFMIVLLLGFTDVIFRETGYGIKDTYV